MKVKFLLLGAITLLLSACGSIPSSNSQGDNGSTSYRTGYGLRSNAVGSANDSHMSWGE